MKSRHVAGALFFTCLAAIGSSAGAQTIHDYEFTSGLDDSVAGGVALAPSDRGTATGTVGGGLYTFQQGAGLSLDSQLPDTSYTIDISATFTNVDGYRKLISFNNLTDDAGLYILDGSLNLYNVAAGRAGVVTAGTAFDARLSRDGSTGLITGYLNGALQFSYSDTNNLFVPSTSLYFLRDDMRQNREDSAGSADYIRISDVATGAPAVTGTVPEPATWGSMILGFGVIGLAMRRRRMTARVSFAG